MEADSKPTDGAIKVSIKPGRMFFLFCGMVAWASMMSDVLLNYKFTTLKGMSFVFVGSGFLLGLAAYTKLFRDGLFAFIVFVAIAVLGTGAGVSLTTGDLETAIVGGLAFLLGVFIAMMVTIVAVWLSARKKQIKKDPP